MKLELDVTEEEARLLYELVDLGSQQAHDGEWGEDDERGFDPEEAFERIAEQLRKAAGAVGETWW